MQHLLRLIESLADIFNRMGLRHAFGGALANNYWGIVRTTQDVDCLVLIPAIQHQRLADELADQGFVMHDTQGREQPISVAAMREQERERKLIEVHQMGLRAELFVPFIPLQDEILRRAVPMPLGERTISVTTAEFTPMCTRHTRISRGVTSSNCSARDWLYFARSNFGNGTRTKYYHPSK